jgi:FixJ family two-component response regulator
MTTMQRIFIVDGDSSARYGLVRLVSKAGHEVTGFDSLEAFLDSLSSDATGCLVLKSVDLRLDCQPGDLAELLSAHGLQSGPAQFPGRAGKRLAQTATWARHLGVLGRLTTVR